MARLQLDQINFSGSANLSASAFIGVPVPPTTSSLAPWGFIQTHLTSSISSSISSSNVVIGALSASLSNRINVVEVSGTNLVATASYVLYSNIANKPTLISSSAQIANDISGSFGNVSSSITTRILDIEQQPLNQVIIGSGSRIISYPEFLYFPIGAEIEYDIDNDQWITATVPTVKVLGDIDAVNARVGSNIYLAETTASNIGVIYKDAFPFLHNYEIADTDGMNLFLGKRAGGNFSLTTDGDPAQASNLIFIGEQSGYNVGNLNNIVSIGNYSGYSAGDYSFNTILIGNYAGYQGFFESSIVIGENANRENPGYSTNNVLIGPNSGRYLAGSSNIYIGPESGRYAGDGSTQNALANNTILIGTSTRVSSSGEQNSIVIGHNVTSLGSNTIVIGNSSVTLTKLFGTISGSCLRISGDCGEINGLGLANASVHTFVGSFNQSGSNVFMTSDITEIKSTNFYISSSQLIIDDPAEFVMHSGSNVLFNDSFNTFSDSVWSRSYGPVTKVVLNGYLMSRRDGASDAWDGGLVTSASFTASATPITLEAIVEITDDSQAFYPAFSIGFDNNSRNTVASVYDTVRGFYFTRESGVNKIQAWASSSAVSSYTGSTLQKYKVQTILSTTNTFYKVYQESDGYTTPIMNYTGSGYTGTVYVGMHSYANSYTTKVDYVKVYTGVEVDIRSIYYATFGGNKSNAPIKIKYDTQNRIILSSSFIELTGSIFATDLTGSLNSYSASVANQFGNISNTASLLWQASASDSSRLVLLEATASNLTQLSASISGRVTLVEATSSQLVIASGSTSDRLVSLEATSSQFAQASSSLSNEVTTLSASVAGLDFSSYVSKTVGGLQTISGSIRLTGDLIAQTYIISSSVSHFTESFSSGSTRFGDSMDDTHVFTGSLNVTGGLWVNNTNISTSIASLNVTQSAFIDGALSVSSSIYAASASYVSRSLTSTTSSYALTASYALNSTTDTASFILNNLSISSRQSITGSLVVSSSLRVIGDETITGSLIVSASGGNNTTIYGSGSNVFRVIGSLGQLFALNDSFSGSLFSIPNISGLPVLEVFSDNTMFFGNPAAPAYNTTNIKTCNSGSTVIVTMNTSSYDAMFVDYIIKSGSVTSRAGTLMANWNSGDVNYTDQSTNDFGDTSVFEFSMSFAGDNISLYGSTAQNSWVVKTIIRGI